jgi:hypothetical protein
MVTGPVADNDLAPEVNRLIDVVVASMDHVDLLRVLSAEPITPVDAETLATAVRIDRRVAGAALQDLVAASLVNERDGAFVFAASPRDREAVAALVQAYNTRPVTLIRAIYARPKPIKAFADAFRLRRSE